MKTALVLSGGGARAAYQVGVLKALAEILPFYSHNPFPIICGTSAGAINAAALACSADHFRTGITQLENLWGNLHIEQVQRAGFADLFLGSLKLVGAFFHRGVSYGRPLSLFDNTPLYHLLLDNIPLHNLQRLIDENHLHALCITALGYSTGHSINFFQGHKSIESWKRARRTGVRCGLTHQHIMASSALPAIFPAVRIHREFFGDGAIRQTTPMSAALHLGASKLLVIGASRHNVSIPRTDVTHSPSLAQIFTQLLSSAFIDSVEEDISTMERFNRFLMEIEPGKRAQIQAQPVDVLALSPSISFDEIALRHVKYLPRSMRIFLKTIGATRKTGGSSITSYLLFEAHYCQELMDCGYADGLAQADKIREFMVACPLASGCPTPSAPPFGDVLPV